jgi:hypothetical protein
MVRKSKKKKKIGEEPLRAWKFFVWSPNLNLVKYNRVLRGNKQEMPEICGDTVSNRLRGPAFFLFASDLVRNAPIRSPLLSGRFPNCFRYSVIIAEKVSNTLWAFPKELPTPFRYCSNVL